MPDQEKETWGDYSRLVLNELERLNDQHGETSERLKQISDSVSEIRNIKKSVDDIEKWMEDVNNVWPPVQMKEAKNEIYTQKNRWIGFIAIITFVEIVIGILIALADTKH